MYFCFALLKKRLVFIISKIKPMLPNIHNFPIRLILLMKVLQYFLISLGFLSFVLDVDCFRS